MIIIINFKNYVLEKKAFGLAKKIERYLPQAIVCVPALDLKEIADKTKLKVFAQHIEITKDKKSTGFFTAESLKKAGISGSLLNHSEHQIGEKTIKETMKESGKNFKIILCVKNLNETKKYKFLKPWAIAFEDPELIGTGKSITKYNPKSIKDFVKILKNTKIIPLCGAGINSKEDILEAKRLGCKGVLISSAIANSKNPEKILKEISGI